MASVIALLDVAAFKKYVKQATPGAVLPVESYHTADRSFATALSHGGALYLAATGAKPGELWLVAVLEAPETSGIRTGDKRKPGWYAPINTTPITDLSKLRSKLKIGKDLATAFEQARILTPAQDRLMRELLDAVDAPVIGHVEAIVKAKTLDAKLPALERATTYLSGGHIGQAIAALCESWRGSRAPEIADLVDRAARLLPEYHRPLFEKRATDASDASKIWNAAFEADATAAMPQLLLNLGVGGTDVIPKRAKRLAELPIDPRFGARLVELLSSRPTWYEANWWPPIVEHWLKARDARTFESLLELEKQEAHLGPRTAKVYAMARIEEPRLPAADRAAVTKIESELHRLEEPLRMECALVDQIAAHPDDDGPYLVYADWLIEHGRPLGEYITLVCQQQHSTLSPAQARRLTHLVELPYLCGAFDDLPSTRMRKRQRGIDRELSVYWSTQPRSWRLFAASPLVRALTSIRLVSTEREGREEAMAELVRAAPMLERIEDIGQVAGKKLLALLPDQGFELRLGPKPERDYNDEPMPRPADLVRATRAGRPR